MKRLAVVLVGGDFRIHAADCRDVARDERRSDAGAWFVEASSEHQVNLECWGDVATDTTVEGSPEWHAECDSNASACSVFLPCVGVIENV